MGVAALVVALAQTPLHASDSVQAAQALVRQGQHSQALDMADRLLARNPRDAQARFVRGIALTELDRTDDAIAVFQKLTQDFPEHPEPYNNLAVLYAQQRQYDRARAALEMAIRTHPTYATAHENLGDVYSRLASQAYDKALQLDSGNTAAQTKLSLIREMMSSPASARPPAAAVAARGTTPALPPAAATPPAPAPAPAAPAPSAPPVAASVAPAAPAAPAAPLASAPASAPTGVSATEQAVLDTAQAWAAAWSRKDVKAYLAHYDQNFRTPGGRPLKEWQREREQRINKPGAISVGIANPRVSVDGERATLRFRQNYRSANFNASSNKTLEFVLRNGTWRITAESVGG